MTRLMQEMIEDVAGRVAANGYAFARRTTRHGEVLLYGQIVNTQSKDNEFRKNWQLDGKRISAAKLEAICS